jgi:hypothetical protein
MARGLYLTAVLNGRRGFQDTCREAIAGGVLRHMCRKPMTNGRGFCDTCRESEAIAGGVLQSNGRDWLESNDRDGLRKQGNDEIVGRTIHTI